MANRCAVCFGTGATKSFPGNGYPLKQNLWVARLNLLPDEADRLLVEWRERLGKKLRVYWCDKHFEGAQPDPIDLRLLARPHSPSPPLLPSPRRSSPPMSLPLLTRQLSEVRVANNSSVSPSRNHSGTFPSTSRDTSAKPLISKSTSQRSDFTIRTEHLQSSQDTIGIEEGEDYSTPIDLPPYLLISSSHLMQLFTHCPTCGLERVSQMKPFLTGSALELKWKCAECGNKTWSSQPRMKDSRLYEGNIKFACAAHTTALPLPRIHDFAYIMGLAIPASRTVYDYLAQLVVPAVDCVYVNHMKRVQSTVRDAMEGRGVDLSVDGRYDSPGFSASNCTVSFVDLQTNLVMTVVNKNKKEKGIDNISGRMEKEGVRQGLRIIQALQLKIRSMCSDNDAKIGKMMRDDASFKSIKHLLDFWHLIKSINRDLRELAKKKTCPHIKYWRRLIVNHAYYVHFTYAKSRQRGLNYWKAVLPHVTGRHSGFGKIPFLEGIKKCKHARLGRANVNLIKRDSEEYRQLKAVILKPTFLAGFLRASPKKNTSPNESFNSIINLYAPKSRACSPEWYSERVKLATLHFNTLALLSLLNLREQRSDCSVNVLGRESKAVKRKMSKADHEWRREVWDTIPGVLERRLLDQFMARNNVPSDAVYIRAMQEEEEDAESGEGEETDGGESDVSIELGVYGEEVDSDHEPAMRPIELSDVEDEKSEEGEEEEEASSGSEWDEGDAAEALEGGGRGRGRGRGGRGRGGQGRGTVGRSVWSTDKGTVPTPAPDEQQEMEREKKEKRVKTPRKKVVDESSTDSGEEQPPFKKGRGKGQGRGQGTRGD